MGFHGTILNLSKISLKFVSQQETIDLALPDANGRTNSFYEERLTRKTHLFL